jgi:subtilisin family serine protease
MKLKIYLFALLILLLGSGSLRGQNENIVPGVVRVKLRPELVASQNELVITKSGGSISTGIEILDQKSATFSATEMKRVFRYSPMHEDLHRKHGLHLWYEISYSAKISPESVAVEYQKLGEVSIAEPLYEIGTFKSTFTPHDIVETYTSTTMPFNDPWLPEQWHYNNTGQHGGTPGWDINLFKAWKKSAGRSDVIVAVKDNGMDWSHEDLAANMWINHAELNGVKGRDDDGNGFIDDVYGFNFTTNYGDVDKSSHGTHVAGTIAAVNNNGKGVSGIAGGTGNNDGVKVMALQILGSQSAYSLEESFIYAADNGAVISQNSWGYRGGAKGNQALYDAIDYFIAEAGRFAKSPMRGGIVFFAAGNDNSSNFHWPGAYDKVISVASLGARGEKASYSNYGNWVDIAAPGGSSNVNSKQGVLSLAPNNGYGYMDGTSMACPHVSGIAALVVSHLGKSGFTNEALYSHITTSFRDIYENPLNQNFKNLLGVGIADAEMALQPNNLLPPDPVYDFTVKGVAQDFVNFTWTIPADNMGYKASTFHLFYSKVSSFAGAPFKTVVSKAELGGMVEATIEDLDPLTTYYFMIKSIDRFGNVSAASSIIEATTNEGPLAVINPASLTMAVRVNENPTAKTTFNIQNTGVGLLKYTTTVFHKNNTDKASFDDVNYAHLGEPGAFPLNIGGIPYEPVETIDVLAQTVINLEKMYFNRSQGGWYIGDTDTTLSNSAAISFFVDEEKGFNLTHVGAYLRLDRTKGPIIVEIREGSKIATSRIVHAQEFLTTQTTIREFTYSILLNSQIYFEKGKTFWIVIHVPKGHVYPFYAGYQTKSGYAELNYISNNQGKSWERLMDVFWDTKLVWGVTAQSKLQPLEKFITLENFKGTVQTDETVSVAANIDASKLINGTYNENLVVYSNQTGKPMVTVPLTITVDNHQPKLVLPDIVEFGSVIIGSEKLIDLIIHNTGLGRYKNATVTISDGQFTRTTTANLNITALGQVTVTFRFKPTLLGSQNAIVTLKGANQDVPTVNSNVIYTFALNGVGAEPPVMALTPDSKSFENVAIGDEVSGSFTVSNSGKYPLKYYVPGQAPSNLSSNDIYTHKFGYTFVADTLNAADTYEWIDIKETGVNIKPFFMLSNQNRYFGTTLAFKFPFMGNLFDSLYITPAGIVSFDTQGSWWAASALTYMMQGGNYLPRRHISGLGRGASDYGVSGSEGVYLKQFPDRFIIQYNEISSSTGGIVTFQIVLHDNGDIKFYYKKVPVRTNTNFWNNALISIGDHLIPDGVPIHSPSDFRFPQYAGFRVKNIPSDGGAIVLNNPGLGIISSMTNPSGIVYTGQSVNVSYKVKTASLWEGEIKQLVNVVSNDPLNPVKSHVITLDINSGGEVKTEISDMILDFGDVPQTGKKTMTVYIKNTGSKNIMITSAEADGKFKLIESYTDLKVGRTFGFTVEINSDELGEFTGKLVVETDIAGEFIFGLKGNIVDKAGIAADATSIAHTIASGEKHVTTFNLTNTGLANLEYITGGNDWLRVSAPDAPKVPGSNDYIMTHNFVEGPNSPGYDWFDIVETGYNFYPLIKDVIAGPYYYGIKLPWQFDFYGNKYDSIFVHSQGILAFENLGRMHLFGAQAPIPDPSFPNNFISPMWGYSFPEYQNPIAGWYYQVFEDRVIIQGQAIQDGNGMAAAMSYQVVLYEDGRIKFLYHSFSDVLAGNGLVGIENADGTKGIQYLFRQRNMMKAKMAIHFQPVIKYVLEPQASQEIEVVLDGSRLFAGNFTGSVVLSNNTPDKTKFQVPVSLTVTGTPAIEIIDEVDFGVLMAYKTTATAWNAYSRNIFIKNTGTDKVILSNITREVETPQQTLAQIYVYQTTFPVGWFPKTTFSPAEGTILPGESLRVEIRVTPTGTDPATGTINPVNNKVTINNISGLPANVINVKATPFYKPVIQTTPNQFNMVANDKGFIEEVEVLITNTQIAGAHELTYSVEMEYERNIQSNAISNSVATSSDADIRMLKNFTAEESMMKSETPQPGNYNRVLEYSDATKAATSVGYGGGYQFNPATKFQTPVDGFNLSHISTFYNPGEVLNSELLIEIRAGGTGAVQTSKVIHRQKYQHVISKPDINGRFIEIKLDTNLVMLPGEIFFVAVRYPLDATYPQGMHTVTAAVQGRYMYYDNDKDVWADIASTSLSKYGYMMKAMEETFEDSGWIKILSPTENSVIAGNVSDTLRVRISGKGLEPGSNKAKMMIRSNDIHQPVRLVSFNVYMNQAPVFYAQSPLKLVVNENSVLDYKLKIVDLEDNTFIVTVGELKNLTHTFVDGVLHLDFTPGFDDSGTHIVEVKATDEHGATRTLPVVITVNDVNRPPVAKAVSDTIVYKNIGSIFLMTADIFSDPDGDALTYGYSINKSNIVEVALSPIRYIFYPLELGTTEITLTASDKAKETASVTFNLKVDDNTNTEFLSEGGINIYPNPAKSRAQLSADLKTGGMVVIRITDIEGRTVQVIDKGLTEPGKMDVNLNIDNLSPGVFVIETFLNGDLNSRNKLIVY